MKTLLALLLLIPSLSWGEHNIIFDGWSIHGPKTLFIRVYNNTSNMSLGASNYSFEVEFDDGSLRVYNTESYDFCPPKNECTWRINFTTPKNAKTMRFIHKTNN